MTSSQAPLKIVFATNDDAFTARLIKRMTEQHPDISCCSLEDADAAEANVAACWFPPDDLLEICPKIELLQTLSAGINHLPDLLMHSGLPICRIVDEDQKQGMLEYVLWGVLYFQRDFDKAFAQQAHKIWQLHPQRKARRMRVGVMGLGQLGSYIAQGVAQLGYPVSGWARSSKKLEGITCYSGNEQQAEFLSQCDLLVNLLPLTTETENILSAPLFEQLPAGAAVINCGRGEHLNEADLVQYLNTSHLCGAVLDVFTEEPLPESNPLWSTPGVVITPHMASAASGKAMLGQLISNGNAILNGGELRHQVSVAKGY